MDLIYLPIVFFIIALFYSSVGFGGGSSYLAILSLFLTNFYEIRTTALLLNICVVAIGTLFYIRSKNFSFKRFWPFLLTSIPMAYLGAQLRLSQKGFFLTLGTTLILSGLFLILKFVKTQLQARNFSIGKKLGLGSGLGLLAGVSGIGGGIFLAPVLNLFSWANPRTIAALASIFIFTNSLAGLSGLAVAGTFQVNTSYIFKLMLAVTIGGVLGSYLSIRKFNFRILGVLTALLVIYVGLRLILIYGFGITI